MLVAADSQRPSPQAQAVLVVIGPHWFKPPWRKKGTIWGIPIYFLPSLAGDQIIIGWKE